MKKSTKSVKYDDIQWHLNEDFPSDLSPKNALTHIGMFMGWAIDRRFESDFLKENFSKELDLFRKRQITGADFLEICCDSKLVSEDFSHEIQPFVDFYYATDDYYENYIEESDDNLPTIFHEPNSWEKYEIIKKMIDEAYQKWVRSTA